MMKRNRLIFGILFVFLALACAHVALAQAASTPPATNSAAGAALIERIIALAGGVALALEGLKKFSPAFIQGNVARVLSILLAIAMAYAAAAPSDVGSIQFLLTTVGAALGANGIHGFGKLMGGAAAPPA